MSLTKASYSMVNGSPINVLDYGALGDGSGATPTSTGQDITNAAFNVWPSWVTFANYLQPAQTSSGTQGHNYGDGTSGWYAANKPFSNSDSWDFIGIQLAIWAAASTGQIQNPEVYMPGGNYKLTQAIRYTGPCRATLRGAGQLNTNITYKDFATFAEMKMFTLTNAQKKKVLLYFFRTGGIPTLITDIGFGGPGGVPGAQTDPTYNPITANGAPIGIAAENTDSLNLNRLFITAMQELATFFTSASGIIMNQVVSEFAWYHVWVGNDCYIEATDCGYYQSYSAGIRSNGIWCEFTSSRLKLVASGVFDFVGTSIRWDGPGIISSNNLLSGNDSKGAFIFKNDMVFTNNTVSLQATNASAGVTIENRNVITGNYFSLGGSWGAIAMDDPSALILRQYNTISGNTFNVTSSLSGPTGISLINGYRTYTSSYVNGGNYNLVVGNVCTLALNAYLGGAGTVVANNVNIT